MSGFSASDPVRQLLGMLADAATYKKRIKELGDAIDEADAAAAKLSDTRDALAADQAKHLDLVERHNARVADFEATKLRVMASEQKFSDRETTVAKLEAQLTADAKAHAKAVDDFTRDYTAKKAELNAREKAVMDLEEHLANLQINLAAKEKDLSNKLSKLREIAA